MLQQTSPRAPRYYAGIFLALCLFAIASFPRLLSLSAHWSSDEVRWLRRSSDFMSAITQREFSKTLIAYHPGVTTMWIAGLRTFFTEPRINVENLASARSFLGVAVWIGLSLACILLYRLFGFWISIVSFASLAYSPFFLAQARRVHTDAIAAVFILLTVLLFLLYCKTYEKYNYLIFSGITFGLACLSKSYSLILLVWFPICLFLFWNQRHKKVELTKSIPNFLCLLSCGLLTVLILWPIFWTPAFGLFGICLLGPIIFLVRAVKKRNHPTVPILCMFLGLVVVCVCAIQTTWSVLDKVNWAVTTPHEVEHFFLGKVVYDPGWLFYPFVLTIKSTPLMIPLALIGCILLWKQRKHSDEIAHQFRMVLALVAGIMLFTVCLSATSKKFSRYLLPAFPMLEILAAIGLVQGFKWVYAALCSRFQTLEVPLYKNALLVVACLAFFFIQTLPVLALHPYYGTYYNLCWKVTDITKIITVGEASGLDLAAKYLNEKPNAQELVVQVSPLATEFVSHYFRGHVYRADRQTNLSPDYEIVYIRDSQIGRVPETGTLNGELESIITLNGIDHVWIYRVR